MTSEFGQDASYNCLQPKLTVQGQGGRRPNLKLSEFDTRAHYNVEPQLPIKTVGAIMGEQKN